MHIRTTTRKPTASVEFMHPRIPECNGSCCGAFSHSRGAQRQAAFTLLELLVVVAIIGLLAAYVGPRYFAQVGKSEQSAAKAQIVALSKALAAYRLDIGEFPTTEQGLNALVVKPSNASGKWNGPYMEKAIPNDPWGRPYEYRSPGAAADFDLYSYGKDGQPGGDGDQADIAF